VLRWFAFSIAGLLSLGCDKSNTEWCSDQLQVAEAQMRGGQLTEAERTLAEVYSRCRRHSVSEVQQLRSQLTTMRQQRKLDEARKSERDAEQERTLHPTLDFVHWALDHRGALPSELEEPQCAPRGEPDFGFCEAKRPGHHNMSVRYWQKEPAAARYLLTSAEPPSCQDVGEHRSLPTWTWQGQSHTLCELTERKYRQFSALLVGNAEQHQMYLFSRAYLQHDKDFERRVSPAGAPK